MADYDGPHCTQCGVRACALEPGNRKYPPFCPMTGEAETLADVEQMYAEDEDLRRFALESARTEAAGYCQTTRIEDIMDFARRI